jgi:hypothetical protein
MTRATLGNKVRKEKDTGAEQSRDDDDKEDYRRKQR